MSRFGSLLPTINRRFELVPPDVSDVVVFIKALVSYEVVLKLWMRIKKTVSICCFLHFVVVQYQRAS